MLTFLGVFFKKNDLTRKTLHLTTMNVIGEYDLGYPFQFSIMGFGYTFLIAPIVICFFFLIGGLIAGAVLIPVGFYFVFIRKSLLISEEGYKLESRLPGKKWGNWNKFDDFKGITIKYTILNAKGNRRGNAPQDPMKKIDLTNPNQNSEDTAETWLVHLINSQNEKILLINTNKQQALKIVLQIMKSSSLKPYLSNYRKGFELDEMRLEQGVLKLSQ